jgi:hypothetical protein
MVILNTIEKKKKAMPSCYIQGPYDQLVQWKTSSFLCYVMLLGCKNVTMDKKDRDDKHQGHQDG